ncbi:hypothetical protein [Actinomadura sp. 6N118]|uniref:hypothetical protein n=1 Tax=Actinomadura sp. 6N118 TaxID=3375151 RepID=UPI00378E2CF9
MSAVTYARHYCSRQHRTFKAAAACIFGKSPVTGEGQWAFVHEYLCFPEQDRRYSIELYSTEAEAQAEVDRHNGYGKCSGSCAGHRLVRIADLDRLIQVERNTALKEYRRG